MIMFESLHLMRQLLSVCAACVPQCCAKHSGRPLYVQAKATILALVISQISYHLILVMDTQDGVDAAGHVKCDDQAWHEEHGASVVTGPVTIVLLQSLVEQQSCSGGLFALLVGWLLALGNLCGRHDAPSFAS